MKFSIDSVLLSKTLSTLATTISKNTANKQGDSAFILIEAKDTLINLTGNDALSQISLRIFSDIESNGSCCIKLDDIVSIAKHLPKKGDVLIDTTDDTLNLYLPKAQFQFSILPALSFKPWAETIPENQNLVSSESLKSLIQSVMHCAENNETLPQLSGIFLTNHNKETSLRTVATDGSRLSLCENTQFTIDLPENGLILPIKIAKEILRLTETCPMISFNYQNSLICVSTDTEIFYGKLIDANYPEYRPLLNQSFSKSIDVPRKDLIETLERTKSILKEKPIIKICIDSSGLHIKAKRDQASAVETVKTYSYEDDLHIEIPMNALFLLSTLKAMVSQTVTLSYDDLTMPILITGVSDPTLKQIIMPSRG